MDLLDFITLSQQLDNQTVPTLCVHNLPIDSQFLIFSFLDRKSIGSCILVCKDWYKLSKNQNFWKSLCDRLFKCSLIENNVDWKKIYLKITNVFLDDSKWQSLETQASCHFNNKSLVTAEFIYQKGLEKFQNCSPLLGNYANFHWNCSKRFDLAEKYYFLAMKADKTNPWPICNYATFLWDIKKDFENAEKYYEMALICDDKHIDALLNFADFLNEIKDETDRAQQLFLQGLELKPNHVKLLGHYALFLLKKRKDIPAAEALYRKAADQNPDSYEALGNLAWFLTSDYRTDPTNSEKYYKKSLNQNPNYFHANYNYACFLADVKHDFKTAEHYFNTALQIQPTNTKVLLSLSAMYVRLSETTKAESVYLNCLKKYPNNHEVKRSYGYFLLDLLKDFERAERINFELLNTRDPHILINYALSLAHQYVKPAQTYFALFSALENESISKNSFFITFLLIILFIISKNEEVQYLSLQIIKSYVIKKTKIPEGYTCQFDDSLCAKYLPYQKRWSDSNLINDIVSVLREKADMKDLFVWAKWKNAEIINLPHFSVIQKLKKLLTNDDLQSL